MFLSRAPVTYQILKHAMRTKLNACGYTHALCESCTCYRCPTRNHGCLPLACLRLLGFTMPCFFLSRVGSSIFWLPYPQPILKRFFCMILLDFPNFLMLVPGPCIPLHTFTLFATALFGFWSYLIWNVVGSLEIALYEFQYTNIRNFWYSAPRMYP